MTATAPHQRAREVIEGVDLTPGTHQDSRGVDLTLIRHCLNLTPAERLAENEAVIAWLDTLERSQHGAR